MNFESPKPTQFKPKTSHPPKTNNFENKEQTPKSMQNFSIHRARAQVIDYSVPYFHSGLSLLADPQSKSEIPLLAFLLPFSPELWIAIFTSLNVTAIAVAIYEWRSPFGLNPWGRQRSKNFSMSSGM